MDDSCKGCEERRGYALRKKAIISHRPTRTHTDFYLSFAKEIQNKRYKARVVGGEVAEDLFERGLCLPLARGKFSGVGNKQGR